MTQIAEDRESVAAVGRVAEQATLAAGLFALSFATALFWLAIFKLISFFIMPSLFFDLLFIGFPLGAFLAARWLPGGRASLVGSLWVLQATMAASVSFCLLAKRFDYLRAHLFDIEVGRLAGQIAVFVALFLPFFAAYGMSEFLAYQYGRRRLGGRMRLSYALALFGAASAYLFLRMALPALGMARVLALAFLGVAGATAALGAGGPSRRAVALEAVALGLGLLVPGVEGRFLALYKGSGQLSTHDFEANMGCRSVFQQWGRYSLCEILAGPGRSDYYGFYNDMLQWEYSPKMGFAGPGLGLAPIVLTRPGQSIAIIGSGGGRQVRLAEKLGGRSVLALELEPAVFEAVRGPENLLRAFGRVYEAPGVRAVREEARGYFERTDEKFDLIYLPSVGGYAQMMIEPGNMIRTFQAHRLLRDHLTDRGVLAIWYPVGLDARGILTDQYVRTLRSLAMPTQAYRNEGEWLILARRDPSAEPYTLGEVGAAMMLDTADPRAGPALPRRHEVEADARFVPITDEKPFLAGNVRYILSIRQVLTLFALAAVLMAGAGAATWLALRRRGDPRIPGRPFWAVGILAILIGANFLLVEHALVLSLFGRMFVYEDALGVAVVSFLCLSGVGSLAGSRVPRPWLMALSAAGVGVLLIASHRLPVAGLLIAAAPIALTTGSFFPALFERAAENPLAVFALDAIGAGLGAVLATFVPILWGFGALFAVATAVFVLTATTDAMFHRRPRTDISPVEFRPRPAARRLLTSVPPLPALAPDVSHERVHERAIGAGRIRGRGREDGRHISRCSGDPHRSRPDRRARDCDLRAGVTGRTASPETNRNQNDSRPSIGPSLAENTCRGGHGAGDRAPPGSRHGRTGDPPGMMALDFEPWADPARDGTALAIVARGLRVGPGRGVMHLSPRPGGVLPQASEADSIEPSLPLRTRVSLIFFNGAWRTITSGTPSPLTSRTSTWNLPRKALPKGNEANRRAPVTASETRTSRRCLTTTTRTVMPWGATAPPPGTTAGGGVVPPPGTTAGGRVAPTSTAPMSDALPTDRGPKPRWSAARAPGFDPASMAGLPAPGSSVGVGPPLS